MAVAKVGTNEFESEILLALQSQKLPTDVLNLILHGQGQPFLIAIAEASFDYQATDLLLPLYFNIAADTTQRWIQRASLGAQSQQIRLLACLARILPLLPNLGSVTRDILTASRLTQDVTILSTLEGTLNDEAIASLLIAIFRVLSHDLDAFTEHIRPVFLCSLFSHACSHIRYLAVQCFCMVMRFADALVQNLTEKHVGVGPIQALWEGKEIDYRLFKLYEERRWEDLRQRMVQALRYDDIANVLTRFNHQTDLHVNAVSVAGILTPRITLSDAPSSSFVLFETSAANLKRAASSLNDGKPTLLVGPSGAGKTATIREIARSVGALSDLVTLHLNEQTDAKSLLGIYTSSASGSGFLWQPGVLTKAVQEGRWVLIEDIDRAPAEVIGLLRPLIETNRLFLPSRKEKLRASEGFRLFGTIRSSGNGIRHSHGNTFLSNPRLWNVVQISEYVQDEIRYLLNERFPTLSPFMNSILSNHTRLINMISTDLSIKGLQIRLPNIRDLLKWCRRLSKRFALSSSNNSSRVPETFTIDMLKDAIDCYTAHLSDTRLSRFLASAMAESLNVVPAAAEHLFLHHSPIVLEHGTVIQFGRSSLSRLSSSRFKPPKNSWLALTRNVRQIMEAVAATVDAKEPLLLVGETGVGKTSIVQHLATSIGQSLTVVNLSNQSEASDLVGGLKPVTTHSLIVPLVDEFNDLFDKTFSVDKNGRFRDSIIRALAKRRLMRVVGHWEEAVELALKSLSTPTKPNVTAEQTAKRRKLDDSRYSMLRERWSHFAQNLNVIKAQVQKGKQNQVFAFVESRLVQTLRTGGWLLLDEVNLASSETLDSIQSLLHNGDDDVAHLFLTEAGNVERLNSHPNFRIMAAMNPATDTGKKDLPAAIRAHFTEIFVHAGDNDQSDLIEIIQTYLGSALENDKRAASDLAKAYLALKQLNEQRRLTDGAGDLPHYSLRTLTRCLRYVRQHGPSYGLRRAMYEGLQMSFFTVLDHKSQQTASHTIEQHLITSPQAKQALSTQKLKVLVDSEKFVSFEHHVISRGLLQPESQSHYIITNSVKRNLMNLSRAASMKRFPVLLQGPTSAGKTSMVEYLARLSGNKFVRLNNHEHTDLQEYLGSYASGADGKLEYQGGVLVEALRMGHWIVLDELNLAPSDVLEALNRLLDDNRELLIPETQEVIRPHPNFMLFATQNPAGLYGGRKRLSRAFRNRFLEIHVDDIPQDELEIILTKRAQIAPAFCREIVEVYKRLSLQRQSSRLFEARNSFATLRDLFRWASRAVDTREQLARHGYMLLAERVRDPAEKAVVKSAIESTMKVKIDETALYDENQVPQCLKTDQKITWTKAMRRLFVLVSQALANNEPVLLVGETGCGKTQISQCVAEAFGKELNIYNAHSNTETGDLLGSQRPVRQKSDLAKIIMEDLLSLGEEYNAMRPGNNIDIDELIDQFKHMDTAPFDKQIVTKVNQSIAAYQSLFVWNDGSLIRAMKEGSHFLLDEISLADDSVLERMNSLLEPSRTVLLAEKGTEDNLVVAEPGFQFISTMNPGGDYGKRELSAALRNRLTEIWVPPLSDEDDVIPILQTRLQKLDPTVALRMVEFAKYFRTHIEGSNVASLPLRTLLSWAEFASRSPIANLQHSIVHGAAIAFIDSLGANPAGLSTTTRFHMTQARELCLKKLSNLFNIDAEEIYNALPVLQINPDSIQIGSFTLARSTKAIDSGDLVFEAPTTLRNAMRILRALQTDRPLLLEGNPGVGKTAIVSFLAKLCGRPLTRINLSDQTDIMDLFGADAPAEREKLGNFVWRDGPLLRAIQTGGWVLLDEMNLASQSVLEGLNACLDHRKEIYISELDRAFRCHPEFTLFATQNPHHQGGGRKGLPASFVNRFTVVYADPFSEGDLVHICRLKQPSFGEDEISRIVSVIDRCQAIAAQTHEFSDGGPWELNLRDLNRWMDLCASMRTISPVIHFGTVIAHRFRDAKARELVMAVCCEVLGIAQEEENMYCDLSKDAIQIGTALCQRSNAIQNAWVKDCVPTGLLPAAKSFLKAWQQRWPVILVGSSGSGKTSLVRVLAALRGDRLVEFSMTNDVDTTDLVGGFEQNDPGRTASVLRLEARDAIGEIIHRCCGPDSYSKSNDFLLAYEKLQDNSDNPAVMLDAILPLLNHVVGSDRLRIEAIIARLQSLHESMSMDQTHFVWNDGILIDAVKSGSWLVLDNANLCNPSVLDRLNSLLEPNGCLVLSEQHHRDGDARIVHPHPDFRIIMTIDPKYGELSRAMRNRSLEIYMDTRFDDVGQWNLPKYPTDSSVARLRSIFNQVSLSEVDFGTAEQLEPWIDQLTNNDISLLDGQQIDSTLRRAQQLAHLRTQEYPLNGKLDHHMNLLTQSVQLVGAKSISLPRLVAINEPLLPYLVAPEASIALRELTRIQLLSNTLLHYQNHLRDIQSGKRNPESQSWLNITNPGHKRNRRIKMPPVPAYSIVNDLAKFASSMIEIAASNLHVSKDYYSLARDVTMLLVDLFALFDQSDVESSQIRAYVQISEDVQQCISINTFQLSNNFFGEKIFRNLEKQFELTSGQHLQKMWPLWKPKSASTKSQLESQLAMEMSVARFDTLSTGLPQSRDQLAGIRLQMLDAHKQMLFDSDSSMQLEALNHSIAELTLKRISNSVHRPLFAGIVRTIRYKTILQGYKIPKKHEQVLFLLSNQPAVGLSENQNVEKPMHILSKLNGHAIFDDSKHSSQVIPPGEIGLLDLAKHLQVIYDQPIGTMHYAHEEFMVVVKSFCNLSKPLSTSNLDSIRQCAFELLCQGLIPHSELFTHDFYAKLLTEEVSSEEITKIVAAARLVPNVQWPSSNDDLFAQLQLACVSLQKNTKPHNCGYEECGKGLSILSLAILRCLVPDKMFDPAVYPALVRERHERRRAELRSRIEVWRSFQKKATGQDTSLVLRILNEDLIELGESPEASVVYRPENSAPDVLDGEFQNLLKLVVNTNLVQQILNGDQRESLNAAEQLLNRIKISQDRLLKVHRCYDDLIKPVIGLLHVLDLGLRMITHCVSHKSVYEYKPGAIGNRSRILRCHSVSHMDYASLSLDYLLNEDTVDDEQISRMSAPQLWSYLNGLKLKLVVTECQPNGNYRLLFRMTSVIDRFYWQWKQQLSHDQSDAEKQARYYSYRGEDNSEDPSDEEVRQMFPRHDVEEQPINNPTVDESGASIIDRQAEPTVVDGSDGLKVDVRKTATELAKFHRSLFNTVCPQELTKALLRHRFDLDSELRTGFDSGEVLTAEAFPALLLSLDGKAQVLSSARASDTLNIYVDHDIAETRKLFEITVQAQSRFRVIAERWSDHAVPAEVLAFCNEVMNLKISDSIARIMTKTEKLLEIVTQWQLVASKEWSVSNILDSLTNLIIHWRRLELGSWSRLLDLEDKKQQDDADAWYFIAYEAVIHNSLSLVHNAQLPEMENSLAIYAENLAKTLEEYLRNASFGQYSNRLELLEVFANTMKACAEEMVVGRMHSRTSNSAIVSAAGEYQQMHLRHHNLMKLHSVIVNVVDHYTRYLPQIQHSLKEGRLKLEKDIVEQIKLASWKDTNITALRESARRSHFKLFKIVKKYRALLAQPIINFQSGYVESPRKSVVTPVLEPPKFSIQDMEKHVQHCSKAIIDWTQRPERLKNPVAAANTMHHAYRSSLPDFAPSTDLHIWYVDVSESVQELRKATPSVLTDDNAGLVRDLKQRKRRLLAESLRGIGKMGIRRNLGTSELDSQSSTAVVFSSVPSLIETGDSDMSARAKASFHELVDLLPPARKAAIQHAEDLTDGETRRGLGYLEGFFHLATRQRVQIGSSQVQLTRFATFTSRLTNLQRVSEAGNLPRRTAVDAAERFSSDLTWLPVLLDVTADVIDIQSSYGSLNTEGIVSSMRTFGSKLRQLHSTYVDAPTLPIVRHASPEAVAILKQANEERIKVRTSIENWVLQEPQIQPTISQLIKWLDANVSIDPTTPSSSSLSHGEIDKKVEDVLNTLFVALQQSIRTLTGLACSSKDQNWLISTSQTLQNSLAILRLDSLSTIMESLFAELENLQDEDINLVCSILIVATPIITQFQNTSQDLINRLLELHIQTCQVAVFLGKTFTSLVKEGFCSPAESSDTQEQSGKVEQGTGLGEGEAAQDISKDVGDDEDLTDLAKERGEQDATADTMDKSKDAVDMGMDELEGDMGSGEEQEIDESQNSGDESDEGQDMDEQMGQVDDLDPNAVDEKLWDDMKTQAEKEEKEMKSQKAKGQKGDDDAARTDEKEQQTADDPVDADEGGNESPDDAEGEPKPDGENLDPHLDQEQALELPEDVQLNGETGKDDDISDADMNDLSDVEDSTQAEATQDTDLSDDVKTEEDRANPPDIVDGDANDEEVDEELEGQAQDDEMVEDPQASEDEEDTKYAVRQDDTNFDAQDQENGDAGIVNTNQADTNAQIDANAPQGQSESDAMVQESQQQGAVDTSIQEQDEAGRGEVEQGFGRHEEAQNKQDRALQKIADVLEQYYQRREIFTANQDRQGQSSEQDVEMADVDFEHLEDEEERSKAQALGTATEENAQDLSKGQAIEDSRAEADSDLPMPGGEEKEAPKPEPESLAHRMSRLQKEQEEKDSRDSRGAVIPDPIGERPNREHETHDIMVDQDEMDTGELPAADRDANDPPPDSMIISPSTNIADAQHLWSLASNKTQSLSLVLTEQLRLILQPTTATKLRGDFRTGKRLNIRRIIPYIASGYKRDKIWMRRSVPSKRNYQIMLAVDDSKSMAESGADILALETLCMLSRSLSMLEVGELSIVAFGKNYNDAESETATRAVKIAHAFANPFSPNSSGPETFRNFSFDQTGTDIRGLLKESIALFKEARARSSAREAADLWQLQIIISDGHIGSSGDDTVRRLVRQAREEKIVSVFVIVDNGDESIVDLPEVVFEKGKEGEEPIMTKKRYLDGFPFQYYVVVREVRDLPGVLSRVLKGWFEGVVEQA